MAHARTIELSNGDTPEWTRLDFESYSEQGKIIRAVIDIAVPERIFDFKRKCWFIPSDIVSSLIKGLESLLKNQLHGWYIRDERQSIETFEAFFTEEAKSGIPQGEAPKKSKVELIKNLEFILKEQCKLYISLRDDCPIDELKKSYRKAALILHPDRNNGDASMMTELNVVWSQLQNYYQTRG